MRDLHTLDKYRQTYKEREFFGCVGDDGNGCFKVYVNNRSFHIIASNGRGWDHVSVVPCNRKCQTCPTWEEMCAIKDMFFYPEETVVQYHPPQSQYVNDHPFCLHLWKPNCGDKEIPLPPKLLV